ncbi:hypothetical protein REPUB_Repub13aG0073400 [Reevesia pubescens]
MLVAIGPKNSLHLHFSAVKQEFFKAFECLLSLKQFEYPSFESFDWSSDENHPQHNQQPFPKPMKVKSLHLISVSSLSTKAISSIVSKFMFLKNLTVVKCNGLWSLQIKDAAQLRKLVVLDCPHLESLSFEGCSLTSFRYRGRFIPFQFEIPLNLARIVPKNFCLEDAMFDFTQGLGYNYCNNISTTPGFE